MNGAGRSPINFHDQWAPELYDVGEGSNAFLFRGVVPYKLGGIAQLFRYTLPVVTAPDAMGDTVTGRRPQSDRTLSVCPEARADGDRGRAALTLPTATDDGTGTGNGRAASPS
jgi:hypothetical protein